MALKKARRPGGGTRVRTEKTLELANNGLGKDETKTQKLRESASPILKKRKSSNRRAPLSLSRSLLSSSFFLFCSALLTLIPPVFQQCDALIFLANSNVKCLSSSAGSLTRFLTV
jgi:hypothetical protein